SPARQLQFLLMDAHVPGAMPPVELASKKTVSAKKTVRTVLLVDDEPDLLDVATAFLLHAGYIVLSAADGESALRTLEHNPDIDIVVTDVLMPGGMNGVELAEDVRQISPSTRVLFTSGYTANMLAEKKISLQSCVLLHKPYRLAELAAAIERMMAETAAQA